VRFAFPQWRGFESAPHGHLLDQIVDLSGPMGIAYERSVGFYKDVHTHDRPMIVMPRGSSVVKVRTGGSRVAHEIDHASLLIVPRGVEHEDEGLTSIFDTIALFPSASLLDRVAADEMIPRSRVERLFGRCQKLARSRWLEQLLQEYVFARVVSRRESPRTLDFFERQLLVELLASARATKKPAAADLPATPGDTVTGRAVRHIESNLFSRLPLAMIARLAFSSPSTLLRQFRRDTGKTPYAYIKARRLEEARRLIVAGRGPIGDVAALVGYENFGSFSTAFRKHFGASPSSFRRKERRVRQRGGRR